MNTFRWFYTIVGLILFSSTSSFGAEVYGNAVDANNNVIKVGNQVGNTGTADGGVWHGQTPIGFNGATSNGGTNLGGQGAYDADIGGNGGGQIAGGDGSPNGTDARGGGGISGGLFPNMGGKISADGNSIGGGGSLDSTSIQSQGGGAGGIVGSLVGGGGGGTGNIVLSGGGGGGVDTALYQVGGGGAGGTAFGAAATGGQGIVGATIRTIGADMDVSAYGGNTSNRGGGAGAALGGQVIVTGGTINTNVLAVGEAGDLLPMSSGSILSNGGAGAGAGGKIAITDSTINGNLVADGIAGHVYANLAGGAGAGAGGTIDLNGVNMTGSLISLAGVGGLGSTSYSGAGGAARGGTLTFSGFNKFQNALTINASATGGDATSGAGAALGGNILFLPNSEVTYDGSVVFDVTGFGGDATSATNADRTASGEGRDGSIIVNNGAIWNVGMTSQMMIASSVNQARSTTYRGSQATQLVFKSGSILEVSASRDPNVPVITKLGVNAPDIIVENGAKLDVYKVDEMSDLHKPYLLTDIGDMTAFISENPFYNITMSLSGNNTYFSLDLLSFDTVNLTLKNPNAMILYDSLDSMNNNPLTSQSIKDGILYLTNYGDDPADFEKIMDSLTAEPYASALIGKVSIHDEFRKQLNSPATDSSSFVTKDALGNIFTIWANGIGFSAPTSGSKNLYGYDTSLYGFTAGGSYKVDSLTYGIVGGYTHDRQDFNNLGSTLKSDGVHVGVFAEKTWGNLRTKLDVAYSHFSVDSERYLLYTVEKTNGVFGQDVYSVGGKLSYDINFGEALVSPYVTARYLHINQDSFTETGANDYGLRVKGASYDSFTTGVGVVASKEFNIKNIKVKPELELGYLHEWGQTNVKLNYQFIGSPVVIPARSLDAERNAFVLGSRVKIGLVNKSNYSVNLNLAYGAEVWSRTTSQTFYGGVEIGF